MANTNYCTTVIGVDFDARTTTADHTLGTTGLCNLSDMCMYVQAGGTIAASQTDVAVSAAAAATDGLGTWECSTAFASGEYGWVRKNLAGAIAA